MSQDICIACGKRPTCAVAEAAILVVAKDYTGRVTSLCRGCGAGEDSRDETTTKTKQKETK